MLISRPSHGPARRSINILLLKLVLFHAFHFGLYEIQPNEDSPNCLSGNSGDFVALDAVGDRPGNLNGSD